MYPQALEHGIMRHHMEGLPSFIRSHLRSIGSKEHNLERQEEDSVSSGHGGHHRECFDAQI